MQKVDKHQAEIVPISQNTTPEEVAETLLYLTRNLPSTDSFCTKYYQIRKYLGPSFPEAYTDLPEEVRIIIARHRKRKN